MSKEFTLNAGDIKYYHANEFIDITKNSAKYVYHPKNGGESRYFGYCTGGCNLKVFRSKPTTEKGDYFFKHVKGYYDNELDLQRMYSCRYYKPSKGVKEQPLKINPEYLKEITDYICDNSYWIFRYINTYILKGIGIMSADYFIDIIKNVFVSNINKLSTSDRISTRLIAYNILELMFGSGKIEFRNMKYNTINFNTIKDKLDKELNIKYFDYFIFILTGKNLEKNILGLEVIQEKNFGKYLDKPKTLHSLEIALDIHGLPELIHKFKNTETNDFRLSDDEIKIKYIKDQKRASMIISNKPRYLKITNTINEMFI